MRQIHMGLTEKGYVLVFACIASCLFGQDNCWDYHFLDMSGHSIITCKHEEYLHVKTQKIIPKIDSTSIVHKIRFFDPFCEYRFYPTNEMRDCIFESGFACDDINDTANYEIWSNRERSEIDYYSYQFFRKLYSYSDTSVIKMSKEESKLVKTELDSIQQLCDSHILSEYWISDNLRKSLGKYRATQCVFVNSLILKTTYSGGESWPNKHSRITFFVFDLTSNKIFFYYTKLYTAGTYAKGNTYSLPSNTNTKQTVMSYISKQYIRLLKKTGAPTFKNKKPKSPK